MTIGERFGEISYRIREPFILGALAVTDRLLDPVAYRVPESIGKHLSHGVRLKAEAKHWVRTPKGRENLTQFKR